jgi:heterodisulfide reductase subunit A
VTTEGEARIGVFFCECGGRISGAIDIDEVAEAAGSMPCVVEIRREAYGCSKAGLRDIRSAVHEYELDCVVIVGCTPRANEPLFRAALEEWGLDACQLEMVNVREQCALVHSSDVQAATRKALALTRMGVAKAAVLEPVEKVEVDVTPAVMVVGGGVSGLTAAATVAARGFPVKLVEKEHELGGQVAALHTLYPTGESAREFIDKRIRSVREHEGIEILTAARVTDVSGSVGDYEVTVEQEGKVSEFHVGAVIVATGAREADVGEQLECDGVRVMAQSELERALLQGDAGVERVAIVVDEPNPEAYSAVSAAAALKNSAVLKRRDPGATVSLLFNDLSADLSGTMIREARTLGVQFYKYDGHQAPRVVDGVIEVFDHLRGEEATIPCDVVVLAMPLVPRDDAAAVGRTLGLPVDRRGFLLEPSLRLRPGSYIPRGVFVCGSAHYPVSARESVFQGYRAAVRALRHLSAGKLNSRGPRAHVFDSLCVGCGTCVESCPFHAISMVGREGALDVSSIDVSLCTGCGNCTVVCPAKAITMEPYTDTELIAQIDAALSVPPNGEPRLLGLMCEWSAYAAADLAGAEGREYPPQLRILRVGCAGRFDPYLILWAFLQGADGVLLGACDPGMCHYVRGNEWAAERVENLRGLLKQAGFDPRRLRLEWLKPDDAQKFVEVVTEFTAEMEYLGPTDISCVDV